MKSLEARLAAIRAEQDPNRKNLRVAEIVSELFREAGADPVIVGGSAVEFYTDGTYVSGDVDVCFYGPHLPTPRQRESVLAKVGTSLGTRTWRVARTPFQEVGELKLIQIEDLIAERILIATVPEFDEERWRVAKLLVALVLQNAVAWDRTELERVANSPSYRVGAELRRLIDEIEGERRNSG